eukprot:1331468-Amorphochlora_amoeboformis.AAC.1
MSQNLSKSPENHTQNSEYAEPRRYPYPITLDLTLKPTRFNFFFWNSPHPDPWSFPCIKPNASKDEAN